MNEDKILIEVCANTVESVINAEKGGARRVELCDNLEEGGTTPSAGSIKLARELSSLVLHVLIRPRGGDFCYSSLEFDIMKADIEMAKKSGADGVVTGILLKNGSIDENRMMELIELSAPLPVTFHRAFDMVRDPNDSMNKLIDLGIVRVLTSGLQNKAHDGMQSIAELNQKYGSEIIIMPGSGINETNIQQMVQKTGCHEFHVSLRSEINSMMNFRRETVLMGSKQNAEYSKWVTDTDRVKKVVELANKVQSDQSEK